MIEPSNEDLSQIVKDKWPGVPYPCADYFARGFRYGVKWREDAIDHCDLPIMSKSQCINLHELLSESLQRRIKELEIRCEKAEENYQFYHREWESTNERLDYANQIYAELASSPSDIYLLENLQYEIDKWREHFEKLKSHIAEILRLGNLATLGKWDATSEMKDRAFLALSEFEKPSEDDNE